MKMSKSTSLAIFITVLLLISLVGICVFPGVTVAKPLYLSVDVWTNKGGQGQNVFGGTYYVGDQVTIYVKASYTCQARISLSGPSGAASDVLTLETEVTVPLALGAAEQVDVGQWVATMDAQIEGYNVTAQDRTTFTVLSPLPQTSQPPVVIEPPTQQPPSQPPSTSPSEQPQPGTTPPPAGSGQGVSNTVGVGDSSELLALMALQMTEGVLTADPRMDANNDGQVTLEDVRIILRWAVHGTEAESSQPTQQEDQAGVPDTQTPPPVQTDGQVTPPGQSAADTQALVGKWEMTRQSIQPPLPDYIPGFAVNQIIPEKATWVIDSINDDLTIQYNGRTTWYKKLLLGKGITEGLTTASVGGQGTSCLFQTPVKFYWPSLPFPMSLINSGIKEVKGSFTDSVNVSVSGSTMQATITLDNVQGTFSEKDKNGNVATKQIHYSSKITYTGTRK
jgi:hypothetical protein